MSTEIEPTAKSTIEPMLKHKKFNKLSTLEKIQYIENYHQAAAEAYTPPKRKINAWGGNLSALDVVSSKFPNILISKGIAFGITGSLLAFSGGNSALVGVSLALMGISLVETVISTTSFHLYSRLYSLVFRRKHLRKVTKELEENESKRNAITATLNGIYDNLQELSKGLINDYNKSNDYQSLEFKEGKFSVVDRGQNHRDIAQKVDSVKELEAKV